ncbi:MAG: hypothetical protein WDN28_23275 [Chthoniobacter sp.]
MRDATGKDAETFELLGLLELALEELPFQRRFLALLLGHDAIGDVLDQREDGHRSARLVVQHGVLPRAVQDAPELGQVAILTGIAVVGAIHQPADHFAHDGRVLRVDKGPVAEMLPHDLIGAPAEHALRLPRPARHPKVRSPFHHGQRRVFHMVDEAQLRGPQFLGRAPHVGHIAGDADDADDLPGFILQRKLGGQKPAPLAAGGSQRAPRD